MTAADASNVLYVIVCAAGPAGDIGRLADLAQERCWTVQIIATPSALALTSVRLLARARGTPIALRHPHRQSESSRGHP
jgi:hypothetical protein